MLKWRYIASLTGALLVVASPAAAFEYSAFRMGMSETEAADAARSAGQGILKGVNMPGIIYGLRPLACRATSVSVLANFSRQAQRSTRTSMYSLGSFWNVNVSLVKLNRRPYNHM